MVSIIVYMLDITGPMAGMTEKTAGVIPKAVILTADSKVISLGEKFTPGETKILAPMNINEAVNSNETSVMKGSLITDPRP